MKKLFLFSFIFALFGLFVSCDFFGSTTTTVITTTTEEVTSEFTEEITSQITTEPADITEALTTIESDLTIQLRHIYQLSLEAETFDGTYEEWLDTVKGPQGQTGNDGAAGKEVVFQVAEEHIQWQYVGDLLWENLIDLVELKGEPGIGIASTTMNELGEIIITYTDDSELNIGVMSQKLQVSFLDYNGIFLDSVIVDYGEEAETTVMPEREGHTFIGWSQNDLTNITNNINVYALYDINEYTVSFESNEGAFVNGIVGVQYGSTIVLSVPTREGYAFTGWYKGNTVNDSHFTSDDIVKSDITLFARWESISLNNDRAININSIIADGSSELVHVAFDTDTIEVAYRILSVEGAILEQLSTWVTSDASEIVIETGHSDTSTITYGISTSLSTTFEATSGIFTFAATFEIEASLERAQSIENTQGVSMTFPLDGYSSDFYYSVFLTGNYDVYQVFSYDKVTGATTEHFFFKITSSPIARLIASEDTNIEGYIDVSDKKLDSYNPIDYFDNEGSGTENDPYMIRSEAGLYVMMLFPDKYYKLKNDITLKNFKGSYDVPFTGVFDGANKTISGLIIDIVPEEKTVAEYYGFIGINEGTIKNVIFDEAQIMLPYKENASHAGDAYVLAGVVCGQLSGDGTIDNVTVSNSRIIFGRFNSVIGGIAGHSYGTIQNSSVINTNVYGCGYDGGITGKIEGGKILNCEYIGTKLDYGIIYSTLTHYSTGVTGYSGGIVGHALNTEISGCLVEYVQVEYFIGTTSWISRVVGYLDGGIYSNNIARNVILYGDIAVRDIGIHVNDSNPTTIDFPLVYQDYDGTVLQVTNIYENTILNTVDAPNDLTRIGYTFVGWHSDTGLTTMPNYSIVLTAMWEAVDPPE